MRLFSVTHVSLSKKNCEIMEYNDIYRIATLIVKSIKKDLSEEEYRELDNWRNGSERNRQLYQKYQHAEFFRERSLLDESDSSERIRKGVRMAIAKKKRRALWIKTVSYAACLVLCLSVGAFLFFQSDYYKGQSHGDIAFIKAGDSKAILSLFDGSEYCLDSQISLALVDGDYAIKDKNGTYILDKKETKNKKGENKLFVPRNGKYEITLCDGTKVWVNSDSELYYPSAFASDQRIVKARGEMYFEVSHHDNWPFIIETDYGRVEVKGTSFNLRSYREEKKLVTTLVQGKVLVSSHETEDMIELHPGETAVVTDNQEIDVVTANVQEAISWKDDMFVFRSSTLEQIMEEAARWYDIRIVWVSEERRHTLFSGELPRSKDFIDFVRMIELTEKVSFSVKGRTVYID